MTSIGDRVSPDALAAARRKSQRTAHETMDLMADGRGWAVTQGTNSKGAPRSVYTRGAWELTVDWNYAGHAQFAVLRSGPTRARDSSIGGNGEFRDPRVRSQAVFRWVGHRVYDQRLV